MTNTSFSCQAEVYVQKHINPQDLKPLRIFCTFCYPATLCMCCYIGILMQSTIWQLEAVEVLERPQQCKPNVRMEGRCSFSSESIGSFILYDNAIHIQVKWYEPMCMNDEAFAGMCFHPHLQIIVMCLVYYCMYQMVAGCVWFKALTQSKWVLLSWLQ